MAYPDAGRIGKSVLVRVIFCHILCVSQHHLYDQHIPGMFPYGDPSSRVAFDIIRPLSIRSTEPGTSLPNARRLLGHTLQLSPFPSNSNLTASKRSKPQRCLPLREPQLSHLPPCKYQCRARPNHLQTTGNAISPQKSLRTPFFSLETSWARSLNSRSLKLLIAISSCPDSSFLTTNRKHYFPPVDDCAPSCHELETTRATLLGKSYAQSEISSQ